MSVKDWRLNKLCFHHEQFMRQWAPGHGPVNPSPSLLHRRPFVVIHVFFSLESVYIYLTFFFRLVSLLYVYLFHMHKIVLQLKL